MAQARMAKADRLGNCLTDEDSFGLLHVISTADNPCGMDHALLPKIISTFFKKIDTFWWYISGKASCFANLSCESTCDSQFWF